MAYEPTNWQSGDVVTSNKLNKLEEGVSGAYVGLCVTMTESQEDYLVYLDKTFKDIMDAVGSGVMPVFRMAEIDLETGDPNGYSIYTLERISAPDGYEVVVSNYNMEMIYNFYSDSETGTLHTLE